MNTKELKKLEKEGKYLFHGTDTKIYGLFQPRQAYTFIDGKEEKDGEPAVYATPILDIAIFMAVVNSKNAPVNFHSRFNKDNKGVNLLMNKDTKDQISSDSSGYVYIFNKDDFKEKNPIEYFSNNEVKPINYAEVKFGDIGIGITVLD